MQKYPIVALVGTSGSGKTTLLLEMLKLFPDYCRVVVSNTTRLRRGPEDDLFYHFLTPKEFSRRAERGDFFQTVTYGAHSYGCDRAETDETVAKYIGLTVLIQQGVRQYRNAGYQVSAVRIIPEGHRERPEEQRKMDDHAREHDDVGYDLTIVNSFTPGGLEKARQELAEHIERLIAKVNAQP